MMSSHSIAAGMRVQHLGLHPFRCPGCGPSLLLRLGTDEMLTRCVRCRATPVHLSMIAALRANVDNLPGRHAYELSTTGAVLDYLRRHCREVTTSEYLQDVAPGSIHAGMRCEDVQHLSFADAAFDLCTSTEVFEHVPDDHAGFRELHRVLRAGGKLLFTVPLTDQPSTTERARLDNGKPMYVLPAACHGDRINGPGSVLVYRDHGTDIIERVRERGFDSTALWTPPQAWFGHQRTVVVATRH